MKNLLRDYDLSAKSNAIMSHTRDSVRFYIGYDEYKFDTLGGTRIGGLPDLPKDMEYPIFEDGRKMSFIGQLNLAEIHKVANIDHLPDSGILYFFYDGLNQPIGILPEDAESVRVIYFDGSVSDLRKVRQQEILDFEEVDDEDYIHEGRNDDDPINNVLKQCESFDADVVVYDPCTVTMEKDLCYPNIDSAAYKELNLTGNDKRNYDELIKESLVDKEMMGSVVRVGGYPDTIDEDIMDLVSLSYHGVDVEKATEQERKAILSHDDEWQLLFQVDSDGASGMCWGSIGRLFFLITKDDLIKKEFNKARAFLQD